MPNTNAAPVTTSRKAWNAVTNIGEGLASAAAGRNYLNYAVGAGTVFATLGVMDADHAKQLVDGVHQFMDGLGQMITGGKLIVAAALPTIGMVVAKFAGLSSLLRNRLKSITEDPKVKVEGQIVVADPAVAAAVPSPQVVPVPTAQTKVLGLLLALGLGTALLAALPGSAVAQTRLLPPRTLSALTPTDPLAKIMGDLSAVKTEVVNGVIVDLDAADLDAAQLTNPSDTTSFKDPIAHACYPAAKKFLLSLPTAAPPTGKYVLVQLFQKKRDFISQIKAGLPVYVKLGCTPLFGDEVQTLITLLGMVGVKIIPAALTAALPALAPVTLPGLVLAP